VSESPALLEVRDVSHGVLQGVHLEGRPGQLIALTGHSGSGKSTLCHLVAGFERPTAGTVTLEGRATADIADWSRISVVPQRLALLEQLTAVENLTLPVLAGRRTLDPAAARDLLESLGVSALADRPAGQGSIGEQQRIAVARALVERAALIVLDEPTAHQDDESAVRVIGQIVAAVEAGSLVVISTHDPRLLARAAFALPLGSG
jgi:ABC-type lipoprotein export system ATPase subunit